jgi:DNA-directed RNA polymerase alpha subunit
MSLEATLAELVQMLDQRLREITAELERRSPPEPTTRGIADAHLLWLLKHGSLSVSDQLLRYSKPMDLSELSLRAINAITRSGCKTALELAFFGRTRLLDLPPTGETTVSEIQQFLRVNHGLELAD